MDDIENGHESNGKEKPIKKPHNGTQNLIFIPKGQSGNPNGRPAGKRNRSTIAREVLAMKGIFPDTFFAALQKQYPDITRETTIEQMMTLMLADKAVRKGDPAAYEKIMDSAYGKQADLEPAQPVIIQVNIDNSDQLLLNHDIE